MSDCPRGTSPAARTPGTLVIYASSRQTVCRSTSGSRQSGLGSRTTGVPFDLGSRIMIAIQEVTGLIASGGMVAVIGSQDLLIALALGLLLFGAKRLPELARGLGESLKEFKRGVVNEPEPTTVPSAPSAASTPSSTAPSRYCAACKTPLQADWRHCPKCGAAAVSPPG
jgi:sec-independent protein translocase protein TatA